MRRTGRGFIRMFCVVLALVLIVGGALSSRSAAIGDLANRVNEWRTDDNGSLSNLMDGLGSRIDPATQKVGRLFGIREADGYADMCSHVTDTERKYADAGHDGTLFDLAGLATDADSMSYAQDFLTILGRYADQCSDGDANVMSTDESRLDRLVGERRAAVDATVSEFMAHSSFSQAKVTKNTDGTATVTGNGLDLMEDKDFSAQEAEASRFHGDRGKDGTYADSANQLLAMFGMAADWNFEDGYKECPKKDDDSQWTTAYYCTATPAKVYINPDRPDLYTTAALIDTVKHELSHHIIHYTCGTTQPPIAEDGKKTEAVTNSYAVLFLGADRSNLNAGKDDAPWYVTSDWSDSVATAIHSGRCDAS